MRSFLRKYEFSVLLVCSLILAALDVGSVGEIIGGETAKFYELKPIPNPEFFRIASNAALIQSALWLVVFVLALARHRFKGLWLLLGAPFVALAYFAAISPQ